MLSGWREKWWQSMNHSQLGSQQGIPSLLFQRTFNAAPRGDAELSEHIVSAQMWPCHRLQSHHHPSAAQHSFVHSSSHLNCCKSEQRAVSAKHRTGPPPPKAYRQGERVKGNSFCQGRSHLHYFQNSKFPSHTLQEGNKRDRPWGRAERGVLDHPHRYRFQSLDSRFRCFHPAIDGANKSKPVSLYQTAFKRLERMKKMNLVWEIFIIFCCTH